MLMNADPLLPKLKIKAGDRRQQVRERNSLVVELFTKEVFIQKLNYIHNNSLQPKMAIKQNSRGIFL